MNFRNSDLKCISDDWKDTDFSADDIRHESLEVVLPECVDIYLKIKS